MKIRKTFVLLCMAPALIAGAAQTGTVDFRGLPLGATEAEFKRANPGFDCGSAGKHFATLGDRICSVRGEDDPLGNIAIFGGQPVIYITAHFVHDRFFMLTANFKSDYFDNIAAALQEKYGPPTSKEAPPITTRAGLRAINTQLFWSLGGDTVMAQRYSGTIAEGTVTYRDSSVRDEMRSRDREQVKAGAKRSVAARRRRKAKRFRTRGILANYVRQENGQDESA